MDTLEFYHVTLWENKKNYDKLQVTYEEIYQVKDIKINILVNMYELFRIEDDESIKYLVFRFDEIINGMKKLRKIYIY